MKRHSISGDSSQPLRLHQRLLAKKIVVLALFAVLFLAIAIVIFLLLLGPNNVSSEVYGLIEMAAAGLVKHKLWFVLIASITLFLVFARKLAETISNAKEASHEIVSGSGYLERELDNELINELCTVMVDEEMQTARPKPQIVYLHGPSGVGKSMMLKHIRERMKNLAMDQGRSFVIPYCNLHEGDTVGRIARQLFIELDGIGVSTKWEQGR